MAAKRILQASDIEMYIVIVRTKAWDNAIHVATWQTASNDWMEIVGPLCPSGYCILWQPMSFDEI